MTHEEIVKKLEEIHAKDEAQALKLAPAGEAPVSELPKEEKKSKK